ncbi:heparinase II/III domain-containing protein [Synoicihabitans lomoniglobus]|uniref:Heparinase II/III family protein n=1 Tax=Synoicihabitans lomoniglobus TaxID=2909285 RepID=A0AAF0A112_9BACT|nr:heparinase II/III-family protein [Opitutaceae bacterium LMO-M01]WED65368.1 heparinase II/III family protein [Opitutaceae bacterium LMO-M01]
MIFHPFSRRLRSSKIARHVALASGFVVSSFTMSAVELTPRNLLAGAPELHELGRDIPAVQAALLPPGEWHPFPRASEREAWRALDATVRADITAAGEAAVTGEWSVLRATDILNYVRVGDRSANAVPRLERRRRLMRLVLAECVEGEGRFLDAITDGVWAVCEESYWGMEAHVFMQRAGAGLPDVAEPTVDLGVSETGAMMAWISYLLGPQLDTVSPLVDRRIRHEVERRLLQPCFDRADFWWMGWDTQGHPINNWNPWIASNWLAAALLLEENPERRARHVEKAQRVLDIFINSYPADGGCDEGPSYWARAGASLFEALHWMDSASEGRISIFDQPLIGAMGRYIMTAHIGGDWYSNFADARARIVADGTLVYRYGRAVQDPELAAFGAWLWQRNPAFVPGEERSLGRTLPALFLRREIAAQNSAAPLVRDAWLPDLQFMTARDAGGTTDGIYLAAKGGHNDESHNHNDVGSFIAYLDGWPLFIDAGPEAYTRKTFSPQRYEIWTMRSAWHNVPMINGHEQAPGRAFTARNVRHASTDTTATLTLDLATAYPTDAGVNSWQRTFELERGHALRLTDAYELTAAQTPSALHFLTARPVDLSTAGVVRLGRFPGADTGRDATLTYDASLLTPSVEHKTITDPRLRAVWGPEVHLIKLIERRAATRSQLQVSIQPVSTP